MHKPQIVKSNDDVAFLSVDGIPHQLVPDWQAALTDPSTQSKVLAQVNEFIRETSSYELHDLLGVTALYTLKKCVITNGHRTKYPEPSDLEFLQALLLSSESSNTKYPISRDRLSTFWLDLLSQNYVNSHSGDRAERSWLDQLAASHMAYYRNPYGDEFFDRLITTITSEYDNRYLRDGSFSSAGRLLVEIRSIIWGRFNTYFQNFRLLHTWNETKLRSEITKIESLLESSPEDLTRELDIDNLRSLLINLMEDYAVKTMFLLDEEWIENTEKSGLPVRKILDKISVKSIAKPDSLESLSRANPISSQPFVSSIQGYHLYSLLTLLSQPFSVLLKLLDDSAEAKKRIEKIRGWFAEQEASRMLKEAFPSGKQALSGYWHRNKEERLESDLIILIGSHVLIFEAKGALITERVRAGAPGAMKQFLKKTWGKSTKQGAALAEHIKNSEDLVHIEDEKGKVILSLDPSQINTVSRFSVSIEQVGPFMNSPQLLKDMRIIDAEDNPAPCIILSELGLVFKSLKEEIYKLHYLTRRFMICQKHQIIGDEMDIFSLYLRTGFIDLPEIGQTMMLLGASYETHDLQQDDGTYSLSENCPLKNSKHFKSVLLTMKGRDSPAYFVAGLHILDIPFDEQKTFESAMKKAFLEKPTLSDFPSLGMHVDNLFGGFVVCAMHISPKVDLTKRREAALNMLGNYGSMHRVKQGFMCVRLSKKHISYDALYFGGQLFKNT